ISVGALAPPLPAKAERSHARPDLTDVLEAFRLRSHSSCVPPTSRGVAVRKPDRVLIFVVHDNLVGHFISAIVFRHWLSLGLSLDRRTCSRKGMMPDNDPYDRGGREVDS